VFLLAATVPFYLLWLGPFFSEVAAFGYYALTGFSFRPSVDNPYLPVRSEDEEGMEYGLDDAETGDHDGGIQLAASSRRTGAA
jgi:hypothetical protein